MKTEAGTIQIIADSSGLVSLVTETDSNHQAAVELAERMVEIDGSVLVPVEVFAETLNILGKKAGKETAVKTGEMLLSSETFLVEESNEEIRRDACVKFQELPESVSFTDCAVMAFADYYGLKHIFGFDAIFEKQGYAMNIPSSR